MESGDGGGDGGEVDVGGVGKQFKIVESSASSSSSSDSTRGSWREKDTFFLGFGSAGVVLFGCGADSALLCVDVVVSDAGSEVESEE